MSPDDGTTSEHAVNPSEPLATLADVIPTDLRAEQEALHGRIAEEAAQHPVEHLTVSQRQQQGKAARARVPREGLAVWQAPPDRPDPVDLLVGQEGSRVQELVPVRHARMAVSAFTFYRGAALVMASDLAVSPRTGLEVQLCGDAHLSNFGLFAAPDRSVIFDVNDFDETHPGPFEWDVKRLAASFVLAARDNGLPEEIAREAAQTAASSYRRSIAEYAVMTDLEIWYDRVDPSRAIEALREGAVEAKPKKRKRGAEVSVQNQAEARVAKVVEKARHRDAWSAIEKITEVVDGRRRFRNEPPLLTRMDMGEAAFGQINSLFRQYRATLEDDRRVLLKRYEIIDMGHKVVGVGSVGLLAFVLLLRGRDDDDLMVLQVKQAQASVLEAFTRKSTFTKHGHRVVTGQRLMQAASDSFLGWIDGPTGRGFYVRQLRDMKWSPEPAKLDAVKLPRYASLCGHTLARAHARSGDSVAISAYLGSGRSFDKAIAEFSMSYADQVAADYNLFTAAIADGRLKAHEDDAGAEAQSASQTITAGTG